MSKHPFAHACLRPGNVEARPVGLHAAQGALFDSDPASVGQTMSAVRRHITVAWRHGRASCRSIHASGRPCRPIAGGWVCFGGGLTA